MNSRSETNYEPAAGNAARQFPIASISHSGSPAPQINRSNSSDSASTSSISMLKSLRRPRWLPENIWPFQTSVLEVDGSNIAVTDVGEGPVLFFVHTGFWSFIWRDVIERLTPNFRCICFDAPGTGQSDRLSTNAISLERASRALTAVILALDLNDITLVFHDLGGPSGIAGAARVSERIRGLCAVNAFAWKPSGKKFRGMLAVMGSAPIREFSVLTGILTQITASPFGMGLHQNEASRKAFLDGIGRQGTRAFHGYMHDARKSEAIYAENNRALTGAFHKLPLLTIFGERNDPLGFQPRWKRLFPDARQIVVAKGNHFPMCDDAGLVANSIREFHRERVAPSLK
jgi:pimeloyl-ACP methyl ester carboxylesterase